MNTSNRIVPEENRDRPRYLAIAETLLNQSYDIAPGLKASKGYSLTEYGFKHPSGSELKLSDRGDIQMRTPNGTGFYLNEKRSSALINAKFLHINGQYMQMKLRPDGFRLNGYYLNPEFLTSSTLSLSTSSGTKQIPLFLPADNDTEFDDLLKELEIL